LLHREPGDLAPQADAAAAGTELYQLLADLVQERRANPADDMATALVQVEELDDHQIAMFYVLLAVAGYETTAKLLGNLVVQLQEYPEQRRLVIDDRTLASNAVEESLRYDGPAQYQLRITTEPVVLHGHEIPSGSHVVIVAGAANRDEREFPDPDVFDLKRDAPRHLAFGHGIHFCLGASLARIEAVVALEELLDRFPDYEVDLTGLERRWSSNFRGLSAVPIRLS
jgi:cytochrome P450